MTSNLTLVVFCRSMVNRYGLICTNNIVIQLQTLNGCETQNCYFIDTQTISMTQNRMLNTKELRNDFRNDHKNRGIFFFESTPRWKET